MSDAMMDVTRTRCICVYRGRLYVIEFGNIVFFSEEQFKVGAFLAMRVDPLSKIVTYAIDQEVVYVSNVPYDEAREHVDLPTEMLVQGKQLLAQEAKEEDDKLFDSMLEREFFD